jgi:ABC-type transport system involved in cytochrome bd biosynthesis fused ATPase/permease subunit
MVLEKLHNQRTPKKMQFECSVWLKNLRLWAWKMTLMPFLHCMDITIRLGLRVVAVVGMGGVGKNLMVETLQECFDHFIWLAIWQKFVGASNC